MISSGRKSLTFRLTLLFASVSTMVLLLLGLLIGSLVVRHFEELDMDLLGGKVELLRLVLKKIHTDQELDALPAQLHDLLVGHRSLAVLVLRPGGETLYLTPGAVFPPELIAGPRTTGLTQWTGRDHRSLRGMIVDAPTGIAGAAPAVLAVSTDLSHHAGFMHSFNIALWLVVGVAAFASGFLGWAAVRRGLAPLRYISRSVAGITANRLDQRLSADTIPIELAEVVKTLDEMLARLEVSFHRLSDFSSDLAHELRTPVSNLLTQTQVTLSKSRTIDAYQDVLASNAEEFERLSRMISDMLYLAKSDNNLIVPHREHVDLMAETGNLFEFYEALVEEKGITLNSSGKGSVFGDRLMLRRAINNLLSNAVRHTPEGGQIRAIADDSDVASITLSVENTGETIAPEQLPRLFDRFYRASASRQSTGEGAGLGLAITRSIAHAHGGEVFAHSDKGLTRFVLTLPA
ncbi:MAG: heavy metal sensor histidine kinase [Propionivibrio sp.]|uniref:heavy metal sensor histidine kinase n=1 Tax=Propionivibrio sp. TaxID=2212460 RepID=UPI0025F2DA38|nr:heavy metal sensor histidine kinase [Propionivibrio sp.]MBL0207941.1 heavy metal sensor histidine kinase [Propionivibrio sp.]